MAFTAGHLTIVVSPSAEVAEYELPHSSAATQKINNCQGHANKRRQNVSNCQLIPALLGRSHVQWVGWFQGLTCPYLVSGRAGGGGG